eukprot:SAG31_NODE_706_length_12688_cov_41.991342_6_plen_219_part_00
MAAVLLLLLWSSTAASSRGAFPLSAAVGAACADPDCAPAAVLTAVARQMCSGTPISTAVHEVQLQPDAADRAARALRALGFRTARDLHLLREGGPEAEELMEELRASGEVGVADRAKLRLLIGGQRGSTPAIDLSAATQADSDSDMRVLRALQDADDGMSMDTVGLLAPFGTWSPSYCLFESPIAVWVHTRSAFHRWQLCCQCWWGRSATLCRCAATK